MLSILVMTSKQADKIITANIPVNVRSDRYDEEFTALFIRRDRFNIYSSDGGVYDRADLKIIQNETN